ncbi:MAG: leucine-rich repeat protein [Firmicutes bacterium]|nr:leucine-rich repeat protein [Bacillota bacterium]
MLCTFGAVLPNILSASEQQCEKKIFSTATINDEFADDRVSVVLTKEATRKFLTYTAKDFSDVGCVRVTELTQNTVEWVKQKLNGKNPNIEMQVDIEKYRRILQLELDMKNKENVLRAVKLLEQRSDILAADPDYVSYNDAYTNDYYFVNNEQWGLDNNYGIKVGEAWDYIKGDFNIDYPWGVPSVLVGVIDSGIDASHPDISNRIYRNANHTLQNTLHRDFYYNISGDPVLYPTDPHGHGTHVAGIVAAEENNSIGISGVAWCARLVSLKVSDIAGTSSSDAAAAAIDFAASVNIKVLNYSIGGTNDHAGRKHSIQHYTGLFVCSAGNENSYSEVNKKYPSYYTTMFDNVISVGAISSAGFRATWYDNQGVLRGSNWGETTVDIFAPGANIISTLPNNDYQKLYGTSMAAPHVTGVVAIMIFVNHSANSPSLNLTAAEIKQRIMQNSDAIYNLTYSCVTGGIVNATTSVVSAAYHWVNDGPNNILLWFLRENVRNWCEGILVVPQTVNGRTVTQVLGLGFAGAWGIKEVILPNSIESIGEGAFSGCYEITHMVIPQSVTSIGNYAFSQCVSLVYISLPQNLTVISNGMFEYCTSLIEITIPSGVTSIGENAFQYCSSLSNIIIPNNTTYLGAGAFAYCTVLNAITLSSNLTFIGQYVLRNCISLRTISYLTYTPQSINTTTLFGANWANVIVYIPIGSRQAFINASWPNLYLIEI